MGRERNESGDWVIRDELKENAISEVGAWQIANLLLSVANPNVSISKLTDKEIRTRAYHLTETAVKMLLSNWKTYAIYNSAQIEYVAEIVFSIAFITLKQPEGEGIRKMITGTRTETHNIHEMSERKGGLIFRR